jgi:ribonuclease HI
MKVYVVTAPEDRRGIYETWEACRSAVHGIAGARYQSVASREEAEAMLRGEGVALEPGLYAFVDGNHEGGVGVVIARKRKRRAVEVVQELSLSVLEVFDGAGVGPLASERAVRAELIRLRNVLAELGALWAAITHLPEGSRATVVHDYEGVGAWMTGRWRAKDETVAAIVAACRARASERRLALDFRHQRGHQSTWAGPNELAALNARADALATHAGERWS